MANGLTGDPIHPGSFFGLPDFGVTEAIQKFVNPSASLTSQGGSNLFGGQPKAGDVLPASTTNNNLTSTPTSNPSATLSGSGGQNYQNGGWYNGKYYWNGNFYNSPNDVNNNSTQNNQSNAAQSSNDAYLSQLNTAYDYKRSQAEQQLGDLATQKDNTLSQIDQGLSGVQAQIGTTKQTAEQNRDEQIQQALQTAQDVQLQNRRVLRGLGILNSSAAGEELNKPMNQFDQQRASLVNTYGTRIKELDDFLNQKTAEANTQKNGILSQFQSLYNNIQNDLRFNERQRADAIQAAGSALQERLASIEQQRQAYQDAIKQQQLSFAQGIAQIAAYKNPNADLSGIMNSALTASAGVFGPQTASIYQGNQTDINKKNLLSS